MLSCYRLGDLVILNGVDENDQNEILADYPDSIASKYIIEKRHGNSTDNIDIITKIALEFIERYEKQLPKDISDSTVIHLRLGDVVGGNYWYEMCKRPLGIEVMKALVKDDTNKRYVIGKICFSRFSSCNYDECIQLSNEYLLTMLAELQAEHFCSGIADIDFCCALKSKLFVQGRGFFSKLIVEIRKSLGLKCIEVEVDSFVN